MRIRGVGGGIIDMNKKGFALTETLVVVVFLVTIFTFIYVSVMPLMGKYEDMMSSENDIDIVYKLYHIRKMIMTDSNRDTITNNENEPVKEIRCTDLANQTFCLELMKQMELNNDYVIIYANSISDDNINSIKAKNSEIGDYVEKYQDKIQNDSSRMNDEILFLLDTKKHTITYLYYDDII